MSDLPKPRIFVFDHPRVCSQLFNRLFLAHPQLEPLFHPYYGPAMFGPEHYGQNLDKCAAAVEEWKEQKADASDQLTNFTYAETGAKMQLTLDEMEEKAKIPFVKDHTFCLLKRTVLLPALPHLPDPASTPYPPSLLDAARTNPTEIPDALFYALTPVFLIRHPARMVPSFYRAETDIFRLAIDDEELAIYLTFRWLRVVFDAYVNHRLRNPDAVAPRVVDAEDTVHRTESLAAKLCKMWGIEEEGVQFRWKPVPEEERPKDKILRGFFTSLNNSDGIIRNAGTVGGYGQCIDVDAEQRKWSEEFGDDVATKLRKFVDLTLPDYEYLKQFRIRV